MTEEVTNFIAGPAVPRAVDSWHRKTYGVGERGDEMQANLDITLIDPLSGSKWDELVLTHPNATIFHTSAWARVLTRTYGHKPFYLHFTRSGRSVALLPLMEVASRFTGCRGVCLPFSDFCGPLISGEWGGELLVERLCELGCERKWRHFEIRGGEGILQASSPVVKYYGHKLDLTIGLEELFARFRSRVRGAIRKAEKSGLAIEVSKTREAILEFYDLHCRTRRRHGIPPQPLSFFINIHEEIVQADLGSVILAKSGSRPVAGAVFFHSGRAALYKFGASDDRIERLGGNNLVMWEGIRLLVGKGLETLHFGRTSIDNEGLRRFKLSWNTTEETLSYIRLNLMTRLFVPPDPPTNSSAFHQKLFSKLPLMLNVLAGKLIYPHLD